MPAGSAPPVEWLRDAVAVEVEATSLRQVAREIGMSPTGLHKFLTGATPYSATRRKLEHWYIREESARYGAELSAEAALAALHVLVRDLPATRQTAALQRLTHSLMEIYREVRRPSPTWLRELHAQLRTKRA
ncbi:MAG: hypothetical protein HY561_05525 [Gemmatimonadetes bacterium]|nr:hypothetical protein [Gemmatimonadota bacterium]